MNQSKAIVVYCKTYGSITNMEAVKNLGILSLHRRLSDLESLGYVFASSWCIVPSRYGDKTARVKKYRIIKQPKRSK